MRRPASKSHVIRAARPRESESATPHRVDEKARKELATRSLDRRAFLGKAAIGAGFLALGSSLGYGAGHAQGVGLSGNTRTVITDTEIAAKVIGGIRYATEFIPDPVPAGTDVDPYPGSAIQAALDDGPHVFIPSGTWRLSGTIARAADNITIVGAGKATKLVFDGATPCISAGVQSGWLIANLATDAGGVDTSGSTQTRVTEIWTNNALTDNRPVATGGGGGAGYYGVRAIDFVTSGDGSTTNPYNASAIQNAINALTSRGGVVFVKAGYWEGNTRIVIPESKDNVIFIGEGASLYYGGDDAQGRAQIGTHVRAGFDCYVPASFDGLEISPRPGLEWSEPGLRYILDPTVNASLHQWLSGFFIKNCRFQNGHPALHMTGRNMPLFPDTWQIWHVVLERLTFMECGTGLQVDKGDDTRGGAVLRMVANDVKFQHCNGVNARTVNILLGDSNWKGEFSNVLVEDSAQAGTDYAVHIDCFGTGGLVLRNWDFGDGSLAQKDAFVAIRRGGLVENFITTKSVDLSGGGYYKIGREWWGTGTISCDGGVSSLVLEQIDGYALPIGTIPDSVKSKVQIRYLP